MDEGRRGAYVILKDIEENASYSNLTINGYIAKNSKGSPGFIRELVYGVLRQQLLLDYNIGLFLKRPGAKLGAKERLILRMGFYQLMFMDSVTDYAAVDETVKLAASFVKGQQGFINAVLRSFIRGGSLIKYPPREDPESYLSVRYSFSPWIVKLWLSTYGREKAEALMEACNAVPPLTLRANSLRLTARQLSDRLMAEGSIECTMGKLAATAVHAKGSDVLSGEAYKDGLFSVQDESSQYAISRLNPRAGQCIIDVCAAPGGKSMAAAELMGNSGQILSFDIYEKKTELIRREAERLGITIITPCVGDATAADSKLVHKADAVIADVPCSGLGVVRRKPEIKLRQSESDVLTLPEKQYAILCNASGYVKPGGRLMYSTCTINPGENGDVCEAFLKENKRFKKIEERQLLPSADGTDGFYFCLFEEHDD